ncbi:hypothetical protein R1sor_018907 [Riccia sorocarpa]|uniref:Methyltransferase type 11 domain-containing protein n=1 Tax=Riccia sorocarpa TaxID=122646 RepID=A0ABD3IEM9_9MARC
MVNNSYQDIVNIDISHVLIDAMMKKYEDVPQLQYMRLDVREMKLFKDSSFDSILGKGMFDSLMCGARASAPYNVARMLEEGPDMNWSIVLHGIPRPGLTRASMSRVITDPVLLSNDGIVDPQFALEDHDLHYVYVCTKDWK